jgi:hypothetical protein
MENVSNGFKNKIEMIYYKSKQIIETNKMSENTQLTPAAGYDTKRMIFSEPQGGTIPDSKPQINYKRINIATQNEDGTTGELIFPTERVFSFGVSENVSPDNGIINGYVMPLVLWNRDGASKAEKDWSDTFDRVVEQCKDHLIANREEIEQYELERNDLKKFNPLYYKRDKGKIVVGTGPTLYAKLLVSKKNEIKIVTSFFGIDDQPIPGIDLVGKYCHARGAVKIESIFIGNKISLQVKLYECEVEPMQSGFKRLLSRPKSDSRVMTRPTSNTAAPPMGGDDSDDDVGSLNGDDTVEPPKKVTSKKKVARKVKKVVRKVAAS